MRELERWLGGQLYRCGCRLFSSRLIQNQFEINDQGHDLKRALDQVTAFDECEVCDQVAADKRVQEQCRQPDLFNVGGQTYESAPLAFKSVRQLQAHNQLCGNRQSYTSRSATGR